MEEDYLNLDMLDLPEHALKVLVAHYPDYPSRDKTGNFLLDKSIKNSEKSWLNIISFGLLG